MRLYRLLLHLYPQSFRHEYGGEMRAVFARRRERASGFGVAALWWSVVTDVLANAMLVHLEVLKQDLRYTARVLRRAPGFAATAIVIVALGIGATTAAFSVTDFVLIRPLPFPEPDRLVTIWETTPGYGQMEFSPPNYRDWTAAAKSFDRTAMYTSRALTMTGTGDARRVLAAGVSADLLPTLGVTPTLGRAFSPDDDRPGAPGTVVLAHRFWQNEFGGDRSVIGRTVTFDGEPFTVIGVMASGFHFPRSDVLVWVPNRFGAGAYQDSERANNFVNVVGRLRRGVTIEQARTDLAAIAAASEQRYPRENKDTGAGIYPLSDALSDRARLLLLALFGAAACVLLIACANLANLLLARALTRRRELAVRTAMGAGRERLVRQLLTESLLISGMGGAIGVGLAVVSVPLFAQLVPTTLPIAGSPAVDLRVLLFALALSVATGLVFALAPVRRGSGGAYLEGLRDGPRVGTGRKERLRAALVVAEIAASVALLMSAGLLIRALLTVRATDPGFNPEGVLTLRTELPQPDYRTVAARDVFYTRVLDEVGRLPGVTSAGFISYLPMSSVRGGIWPVTVSGDAATDVRSANNVASIRFVTPGYFRTLGIPLLRGRDISDGDHRERQAVAVVSESFVRRYWPNEEALGKHFTFAFADREVVGVVKDVRVRGLERTSEPQVYLSPKQVVDGGIISYMPKSLAIRTSGSPEALAPAVRDIMRRAEPRMPVFELQPLSNLVDLETASRATQVRVLAAFAAIAFGLAAIGIHGLLSFAVSQRLTEIGVRVALGAQPRDILWMMLSRSVVLAIAGIVPGIAIAYAAGRSMEALLAGVPPADAVTLSGAVGLALVMTLAGTLLPTRRALRVDPITALRAE